MTDPKAIVQEYLINSGADKAVLNAFREIGDQQNRTSYKLQTALKEQREMAETVIRAGLGVYPVLPLAPWLEALTSLVAEREAANWFSQELFSYYNVQIEMARRLMQDDQSAPVAREKVEQYLLGESECDHSVGICVCELKSALGYDSGDPILFPRYVENFISRMRKYLDHTE